MAASPYKPQDLATARHVVTHAHALTAVTPETRAEILDLALTILRKDRAIRQDRDPATPRGPAKVVTVPLAVFQAGPARKSRRPQTVIPATGPFTPGDAA